MKELIENIKKISFFNDKLLKIEELIKDKKYTESYRAIAALIEISCIILLEKVYKEKVEDSNIIFLDKLINKHNEQEISQLLVDINGEYNCIDLNSIEEIEIVALLGNLNDILEIILKNHGNIFDF